MTSTEREPRFLNPKRMIALRCTVALALVASSMLLSYAMLRHNLSASVDGAYIINISGMQRMLSQRTGLMAREVVGSRTPAEAKLYAGKLEDALERMRTNHAELLEETGAPYMSEPVQALYDDGLTTAMDDFIVLSDAFLDAYREAGHEAPRTRALMLSLVAVARNGLLDRLDEVVRAYQRDAEEGVASYIRLETLCLLIGLALLVLVGLTIFRPMARSIDRHSRSLEVANEELREFSYRISHDLRAPIASSLGLVAMAEDTLSDGDTRGASEVIARIGASMGKLDGLIEEVIDVTRNKHVDQPSEPVDIDTLLTETLAKLANLPGFETIRIQKDVQLESTVTTKRLFLQQILDNLLSNAVKYADPDASDRRIEIHASRRDGQCELTISDNGIGVPESAREEIFGMFKRFHPRISFGSGLGLYLVRQNAIALGGDIDYRPLEQGSSFSLNFPEAA